MLLSWRIRKKTRSNGRPRISRSTRSSAHSASVSEKAPTSSTSSQTTSVGESLVGRAAGNTAAHRHQSSTGWQQKACASGPATPSPPARRVASPSIPVAIRCARACSRSCGPVRPKVSRLKRSRSRKFSHRRDTTPPCGASGTWANSRSTRQRIRATTMPTTDCSMEHPTRGPAATASTRTARVNRVARSTTSLEKKSTSGGPESISIPPDTSAARDRAANRSPERPVCSARIARMCSRRSPSIR